MPAHVFRIALVTVSITSPLQAGDLDPPGAPAPTPGPEPRTAINLENTPGDSDSRFRITSPGSYYLTDNITLGIAVDGIEIGADNVTLDLNGFALQRSTIIGFPPLSGIVADSGVKNVTVRNGVVQGFGLIGIDLSGVDGALIEDVVVASNGDDGICAGSASLIRQCTALDNTGDGIRSGTGSTVIECIAYRNGGWGIAAFLGYMTVQSCNAYRNGQDGIQTGNDSLVLDCIASDNSSNGILINHNCLVTRCTATRNDASGIVVGISAVIECVASDNGAAGIRAFATSARIDGNFVDSNARGIETSTFSGNLIVRNRAAGGSQDHYGSIAAGNDVGTIQTSPVGAGAWDNFAP